MPKISALPPMNTADNDDELPIVDDSASNTKKVTLTVIKNWLQSLTGWITTAMIGNSQITAIKTSFGGDFSTSEVNTGFKWVDGKDIYKKTINLGTLPNSTTKNVAHGVTGLDSIIALGGIAQSGTNYFSLPHIDPSSLTFCIRLSATDTNIVIVTGNDRSGYSGYATLWYTRT